MLKFINFRSGSSFKHLLILDIEVILLLALIGFAGNIAIDFMVGMLCLQVVFFAMYILIAKNNSYKDDALFKLVIHLSFAMQLIASSYIHYGYLFYYNALALLFCILTLEQLVDFKSYKQLDYSANIIYIFGIIMVQALVIFLIDNFT